MANRNFIGKFIYTGHAFPVLIDGNCAIGSSGAPSGMVGSYVTSIARTATGKYRVTLNNSYSRLYGFKVTFQAPSGSTSGILASELLVSTDPTASIIDFQCLDAAGTVADPASGSKLYFEIYLSNSSVLVNGE